MKLLRLIKDKIRTDWVEFITYKREQWAIKRETRNLNRAIDKAREWNDNDKKTYYVIRANDGQIYALNNDTIKELIRVRLLPKMDIRKILEKSMSIVTCDEGIQKQYTQIKLRLEESERLETTHTRRKRREVNYIARVAVILILVIAAFGYINYKKWRTDNPDVPAWTFITDIK